MTTPVLTIDQTLRQMQKPEVKVLSENFINDNDILVLCGGFEERVLAIVQIVVQRNRRPRILLIDYLPKYSENRFDQIVKLCNAHSLPFERVLYDRNQPSGLGDVLASRIPNDTSKVFIDVSGMSRLLIVQLIVAMRNSPRGFVGAHIVYSSAKEYPPTEAEVRKLIEESTQDPSLARLFLSSGVSEVCVVPELSATTLGASQSRLIVFPTFNTDQFVALKSELQPSRFAYIHGVPLDPSNRWRTEAIAKLNWIDDMSSPEHFETSTLDYRETIDCLCEIYGAHAVRDRLIVSPTGSKMQAVAVGLFRAFVDDVQIVYPTPRQFSSPHNYTKGIGTLFCLPLSEFHRRAI